MIRELTSHDSQRILEIYRMGLETRNATFETKVPSWGEWNLQHLKHSRYVFEDENEILSWAALSLVSKRKVYEGVAELSVYVDQKHYGKGIGTELLAKVISSPEQNGIWTLFFPFSQVLACVRNERDLCDAKSQVRDLR